MSAKPFRLVDEFEAGLTFDGREPRTLAELAIARAEHKYRRRVAQVTSMDKKLALLDPFLPALAARGIKLAQRDIDSYDHGEALRIQAATCLTVDDKLHAALLEIGFRELARRDWSSKTQLVTLQHGRSLVVSIEVTEKGATHDAFPEVP